MNNTTIQQALKDLHIVSFSTGLSSALAVERVLERYGADKMQVVFMDTMFEDDDNYRFKRECFARWHEWGVETVVLTEGRTPYEVAEDNKMIFNNRRHPCTRILKIEPFMKYLKRIDRPVTVHIGIDFSEVHRCDAIQRNYEQAGYKVDFPLLWKPLEFRPYEQVVREWGIEPPRMYALGYSHANCGGLCVAQGWGDWLRTLTHFPERYRKIEVWEAAMQATGIKYALAKDQSNGKVTPLTLAELRQRHETDPRQLSMFGDDLHCVRCGVGDFVDG